MGLCSVRESDNSDWSVGWATARGIRRSCEMGKTYFYNLDGEESGRIRGAVASGTDSAAGERDPGRRHTEDSGEGCRSGEGRNWSNMT